MITVAHAVGLEDDPVSVFRFLEGFLRALPFGDIAHIHHNHLLLAGVYEPRPHFNL